MPKYKDTDYLHISARIKMLESSLLGKDAFEKIAEARSFEEAVQVLLERGYDSGENEFNFPYDYEVLLEAEQRSVYRFLSENINDISIVDFFRVPYDYQNIKAVLKAEHLGISPLRMMFSVGTVSKEEMVKAVTNRDRTVLSEGMFAAVENAVDAFSVNRDPRDIDIICDKACFENILALSQKSPYDFIFDFYRKKTNLLNISAFMRLKEIKKEIRFFQKVFIPVPGGFPLDFFVKMYDKPVSEFAEELSGSGFFSGESLFSSASADIQAVETAVENCIYNMITVFRSVPFGPQVPVSYLLAKEEEIKNLRVALSAKLAGVSSSGIRERLRLGYV